MSTNVWVSILIIIILRNFSTSAKYSRFLSVGCDFKLKIESSIKFWIEKAGATASKLLRSLRSVPHQWWYFLDHPEIPPDNNLAEPPLRLAVTKRKVSGGSRSQERFKDTANLLTVVQTCRRQGTL